MVYHACSNLEIMYYMEDILKFLGCLYISFSNFIVENYGKQSSQLFNMFLYHNSSKLILILLVYVIG